MNNIPRNIPEKKRTKYVYALAHMHGAGIPTHIGKKLAKNIMNKNYDTALRIKQIKNKYPRLTYEDALFLYKSGNGKHIPNVSKFVNVYLHHKAKGTTNNTAFNRALTDPNILNRSANVIKRAFRTYKYRTIQPFRTIRNPVWKARFDRIMKSLNKQNSIYKTRMSLGNSINRRKLMAELLTKTKKINNTSK
jgi:hypothetical protein